MRAPAQVDAENAIEILTGKELYPSTVDLLALEGIRAGVDWLEDEEAQETVLMILARYMPNPISR